MSNPFAALLQASNDPKPLTTSPLCKNLEKTFGFTLDRNTSSEKKYVYLEEQAQAFPGREMDLEILEHALFERLFLSKPLDAVVKINGKTVHSEGEYYDSRVVCYLFNCFVRNKRAGFEASVEGRVEGLILRNVLTSLKQPDLYSEQELFVQFFDIMKEALPMSDEFFDAVYREFVNDEDGLEAMAEPYTQLLKIIHVSVARMTITMLSPVILELLKKISSMEHLANILVDYSTPAKNCQGLEFANTLIGALMCVSILPKTQTGPYEFFENPLDQVSNNATENVLHTNVDQLIQTIHSIVLNLLKSSPTVRGKILSWFGSCLKTNSDRGKLWNSQVPDVVSFSSVSDGFMLNVCAVLLKLCQPFCQADTVSKMLKVDPTYCSIPNDKCEEKGIHLLNLSEQTCLVPVSDDDVSNVERPSAESYTFVTECFFMAHRSIDLGYKVVVDKMDRLNHEMARIERVYNEALAQDSGRADVVDTIKQRMSTEMAKYLSTKAALSAPVLLEMLFNFISATCYWFNQIAVNLKFSENGKQNYAPMLQKYITFPLNPQVPETLKCIPEFLVENIVSYMVFLRRYNPKMFEMQGYNQMKPMLTCLLIYMGSPKRMKNPHLRARLAEALESLLPFHKDEPPGLNTLGGYQREMLFMNHEHKKEIIRSLLEVFVGIEMTGQSVQFEQKFNYRRPMYTVMDYLWGIPEHQEVFTLLAKEAEENMEAVTPPLFLRFINLLMNDAVFLLDDALANMSKLKEMHTARENGEWESLSYQERAQNMGYLQHIGMIAKFDNILGRDTIKTLERLTSKITIVFTHATMVDRVAAMLNYFLLNLVGPNQKNFKVKDQKEYSFDPAGTVLNICKIYVNLKTCDAFCLAISQDGRSYSPQLFTLAQDVLIRIGGGSLVGELQELAACVSKMAEEHQASEEAILEAPDHFLDPIMSTLMRDPVILPSSKQTVDRTTIARHLLSDQTDPFNRSPLTMDQVIPNAELRDEINKWLEDKKCSK